MQSFLSKNSSIVVRFGEGHKMNVLSYTLLKSLHDTYKDILVRNQANSEKPNVLLLSKSENWSAGADMKLLLSLPVGSNSSSNQEGHLTMKGYFDMFFDLRDMILQTNTTSIINGFGVGGGVGLGLAARNLVFTENTFVAQSGSSVGLGIIGPGVLNSFKIEERNHTLRFNRTKQYLNWMGDTMSGLELQQIYQNSIAIKEAEIDSFVEHYCGLDPEEQLRLSNFDKFRFSFSNLGLANQERIHKNLGRSLFTKEELSDFEELLAGFTNQFEIFEKYLATIDRQRLKIFELGKRAELCPLSKIVNSYVSFMLQQDPEYFKDLDRHAFMWLID